MTVVLVEESEDLAGTITTAIERVRPGTPVAVRTDMVGAIRAPRLAEDRPPTLVILGPYASANTRPEEVDELRKVLPSKTAIVALSIARQAPSSIDLVYEYPSKWRELTALVARILDESVKHR